MGVLCMPLNSKFLTESTGKKWSIFSEDNSQSAIAYFFRPH